MPRQRRETAPLVHARFYPTGGRPCRGGRVRSGWYRNPDGVGELGLERQVGSVSVFLRKTSLRLHWCFSPSLRLRYSSGTVHRVVAAVTRLRGRRFDAADFLRYRCCYRCYYRCCYCCCRSYCCFQLVLRTFNAVFAATAAVAPAAALVLALVPLVSCS